MVEAIGMLICFGAVICIMAKGGENPELFVDTATTSVSMEKTDQSYDDVSIEARILGITLIIVAAACSAGTAVFNRALKTVDISVVMFFHGMFGFMLSVTIFCL